MQGPDRLPLLSLLIILLSTISAAWPWDDSIGHIDGLILRRQKAVTSAAATTSASAATTSASAAIATTVTNGQSEKSTNKAAGTAAATSGFFSGNSTFGNATSHHATKTTSISINPVDPPGGVQMVTPAPIDGAQYFRVGDKVTFAWNYTSLSVTPSAVDVLASCATNNQMYTIALNQSITGPTQAVTWDTGEYESTATIPFVVASYTLVIYDAAQPSTAIPSAGYLGEFQNYVFGIYTPQPYVPLSEFKCSTCNGALSSHERQALSVLLATCTITVLSFSWFAGGFGVFS